MQNIASRNVLRAWEEMEKVAEKLQKSKKPNWEWMSTSDSAWDDSSDYECKTGRDWPTPKPESSAAKLSLSALLPILIAKLV